MQALEVNRKLDKMRVSISKHYQEIIDRDNFVSADKVVHCDTSHNWNSTVFLYYLSFEVEDN